MTATPLHSPFDLQRFVDAQRPVVDTVMAELRAGRKRTHWMWFVFPQLAGLGRSDMAQHYAIRDLDMAAAYLDHPVLGPRLVAAASSVLAQQGGTAHAIFGNPDTMKLHSSLTLFARVPGADPVFRACLDRYFGGKEDAGTVGLLQG
ncbi:DUF1810 domain-containing protein [Pigmentiphaga litoralis]|uniref:Uncharacterized protein (DUF1810 family) n=1 Tax=Pigmentiphaga litoralis TaxID=516702 RepID=A0A7Y9IWI3_9BURK|nr:DUF1810 domain-containing protein [Pigmentiphaga litoralis]NYE22285.1 uncharacterized protein (DUF1810 family) [Pigmentiphaga litoralis]NYE84100.1 uncharacterized protein (DUF1810 family) [Pigmentiphaga litoralis]